MCSTYGFALSGVTSSGADASAVFSCSKAASSFSPQTNGVSLHVRSDSGAEMRECPCDEASVVPRQSEELPHVRHALRTRPLRNGLHLVLLHCHSPFTDDMTKELTFAWKNSHLSGLA